MAHTIEREVSLEIINKAEGNYFDNLPKCMRMLGISILSTHFPLRKTEHIYLVESLEGKFKFLSTSDVDENFIAIKWVLFRNCMEKPLEDMVKPITYSQAKEIVKSINQHNLTCSFSSALGKMHACLVEYFENSKDSRINFKSIKQLKLKFPKYGYRINSTEEIQNFINNTYKSPSLIHAKTKKETIKHTSLNSSIDSEEVIGNTLCGIPIENTEGHAELWLSNFSLTMVDCLNCKYNYELLHLST